MADLTKDRLLELSKLYEELKARIILIDEKYALDYVEPTLDMPDSLYLTKLEYQPKTEQELMELAEQEVAAAIIAKQATLDKNYNTKIKSFATQIVKLQQSTGSKQQALEQALEQELDDIYKRLVNNGLIFSTLKTKYEDVARQQYKDKTTQLNADTANQMELIAREQSDAEAVYRESCDALAEEKAARVLKSYQKLLAQEEALARSIEKYNTGLDEKEAKYQASRARTYESARRAAYNRAYNNSKLYLQMGETAYRRMVEKEKYAVAKDAFYSLRRDEAQAILSMDSFLVVHLGTYYDAFVAWVNATLLP